MCQAHHYSFYVIVLCCLGSRGCTLSAENFFWGWAERVLYVVPGSVFVSECCFFLCYGCAWMLSSVTFYVGMRDDWMLLTECSAEKGISEEEGNFPLIPSSTSVVRAFCGRLCGCRRQCVSGDINDLEAGVVGCFEQLNLNMQAQSVCSWVLMPNCS